MKERLAAVGTNSATVCGGLNHDQFMEGTMPAKKAKRTVTAAHKKAMQEGRTQSSAVKAYLEALEANAPKRGRKRTPESINARLDKIETELGGANPLKRLALMQEDSDLRAELAKLDVKVDLKGVEAAFVKVAKSYSESKGITYSTWRKAGVPADVLQKAGITRGS